MDVNSLRDSAEFKTLLDLTPELQLAVKTQLTPLGGHLVAVGLITLDEYGWLINHTLREDKQAAYLIRLIQQKVQQDSRWHGIKRSLVFLKGTSHSTVALWGNFNKL